MTVQKKICCIAAADVQQEVRTLLDDIRSRIHLTIPILGKNNSVVDYEVVIFVLSGEAKQDECVNVLLKEASDLNKIFLPVILPVFVTGTPKISFFFVFVCLLSKLCPSFIPK